MNKPPEPLPPGALPHISHVEWLVTDLARSCTFLEGLFGWDFQPYSRHYRLYTPEQGYPCVGLMEVPQVTPCETTLVHIQISNLDDYLQRGQDLGARIALEPKVLAGYGRYAQLFDPDGHRIGLFQTHNPSLPVNHIEGHHP